MKSEYVYTVCLKYLCNVGFVYQSFKFNAKYFLYLETDLQKLFETNTNQAADALPRSVDADIIFTSAPYIMFDSNWTIIVEHIWKK